MLFKVSRQVIFLIVAGKAFQSVGAAHINERSPRVAKDFVLGY